MRATFKTIWLSGGQRLMRASRRYLTGTTALVVLTVGFAAAAAGADLGQPAPAPVYTKGPMAPAYYSWTGCYAGLQAGYGWGHTKFSDPTGAFGAPGESGSISPQGGLVG